jgi:hypothetical protein
MGDGVVLPTSPHRYKEKDSSARNAEVLHTQALQAAGKEGAGGNAKPNVLD